MGFEEWFNTYGNLQCDKDACEDAFEAGQQSKQAEVDKRLSDYQLEISQVGQAYINWREAAEQGQAEIDALKAKVNDALEAFNDGSFNYCQKQLEEILK